MRDEAAIALVLVLVVASAGAGYFVGNSNRQTITTTSTSMQTKTATAVLTQTSTVYSTSIQTSVTTAIDGTPCSTAVNQTVAYNPLRVYQLSAPAKAVICVAFTFPSSANYSFKAQFTGSLGAPVCSYADPCPGIKGSASPSFVSVDGSSVVDVAYNITIGSAASTGLYWLDEGTCEQYAVIDLVVGPTSSSIPLPDAYPTSCYVSPQPVPWSSWTVVGVTNATVSYVPLS